MTKRKSASWYRERIQDMMRRGRYGRACRLFHRWRGTSPRLLTDKDKRRKWIERPTW